MKKIILILLSLLSFASYGQAEYEKIAITDNVATASTSKIVSQQPGTGELNYINATALPLSTAAINALKLKADLSTGLLKNGLVQANADPTKINITAGIGIISNFDDPENPTSTIISFPDFIGVTPAYLNTGNITYFAINSSAAVVMQATPFTNIQRRDLIVLGAAIHSNLTTVNLVNNISAPTNADTNQLHDFMEAIGALNVSGNKYSANGANLSLDKSAGVIFKLGVNFANNWKDPHNLTIVSGTALTFRYRTQNGTEGADVTALNPAVYDLANVLTTVPPNRFTIQTVTLFQTGATRIQYGQSTYATMAEAEAAIITRAFVVEPNIAANGITRAYIILRNSTTSLLNASDAKIIEAQKFGGVASGGVAVTDAAIIAALGYTPANDADVVKLTGNQSVSGVKVFNNNIGIGVFPTDALEINGTVRASGANFIGSLSDYYGGGGIAINPVVGNIQSYSDGLGTGKNLVLNGNGGNVLITPTTVGNALIGTSDNSFTAKVNISGGINAVSGKAKGLYSGISLNATANNDLLIGLDLVPVFSTGTFTGVQRYTFRAKGAVSVNDVLMNDTGDISARSFIKNSGVFSDALMADGSTYQIFNSTAKILKDVTFWVYNGSYSSKTDRGVVCVLDGDNANAQIDTGLPLITGDFGFSRVKLKSNTSEWFYFTAYTDGSQQTTQKYYFEANVEYEIYLKQSTVVTGGNMRLHIGKENNAVDPTLTILDVILTKNNYNAWYDLESKSSLKNFNTKTIIVDKSGKDCHFMKIGAAIQFLKSAYNVLTDDYVISVRNGVYDKEWRVGDGEFYPFAAIDKGANRISIIGESTNGTILQYTNTATSRLKVLDIGGACSVENLTVKSLNDGTYVDNSAGGHQACYAIHNDSSYAGDSIAYTTLVKNVKLFSECNSPVGAGLHHNQKQRYENVSAISNSLNGTSNGALYVHNSADGEDTGDMSVDFVNCEAVSLDNDYAINLPSTGLGDPWTSIPVLLQKNLLYTNSGSETNITSTTHSILPYSKLDAKSDLLQNTLANNKISCWLAAGNSTQSTTIGFPGPMTVGTNPTTNISSTNLATRQRRVKFLSAAGAGSMSAHYVAVGQVFAGTGTANDGSGFLYKVRFVPSTQVAVAGERFFAGLSTYYVAPTNVEPSALTGIVGIGQLSTDNTQFYLVYGGSTAQTPIALGTELGSPISYNTDLYELKIVSPQVPANTYIVTVTNIVNGVSVTNTVSGNSVVVPQYNSFSLGHKIWKTNNTTALTTSFDLVSIFIENNF